jgi:hypothetical protein
MRVLQKLADRVFPLLTKLQDCWGVADARKFLELFRSWHGIVNVARLCQVRAAVGCAVQK